MLALLGSVGACYTGTGQGQAHVLVSCLTWSCELALSVPGKKDELFFQGGRGRDSSEEGQGGGEGAFKRREGRVSDLRTEGKRGETRQANRRKLVPSTHQPATAPSVSPVFCLCFNIEAAVFLRDGINAHLMSHGRVGQILRSVWSRV